MYLPEVNPEVGYSIAAEIGYDEMEYAEEQLRRLDEENPTISTWIRNWAERTGEPMGALGAVCVYRMLESQAEANAMAEEIRLC